MQRATRAGLFCLTETAVVQAVQSILQQAAALRAQLPFCLVVLVAAIQSYHECHSPFLSIYP